jgi:hypothetical protein
MAIIIVSCIVDGSIVCEEYINATGCLNTILEVYFP